MTFESMVDEIAALMDQAIDEGRDLTKGELDYGQKLIFFETRVARKVVMECDE